MIRYTVCHINQIRHMTVMILIIINTVLITHDIYNIYIQKTLITIKQVKQLTKTEVKTLTVK